MNELDNQAIIVADHREKSSKIPDLLEENGLKVAMKQLPTGDYIINDQIIIERKTKDDFVVSILQGRLFVQCANLKRANFRQMLLIEGDPYNSNHAIDRNAVQGAILSVSLSWHIPVIISTDTPDSVNILTRLIKQNDQGNFMMRRTGYKPKSIKNKILFFLQGLPDVGPKMAMLLIKKFGAIQQVISATEQELLTIEGMGKKKAARIVEFINRDREQLFDH
jgi:Fanconi anemia group M protein